MSRLFPEVRDFFRRTFGGKYIELRNSGGVAATDDGILLVSSQGNVHACVNAYIDDAGAWQRIDTARPAALPYIDNAGDFRTLYVAAGANPIVWGEKFRVGPMSGTASVTWDQAALPADEFARVIISVPGAAVGDFVLWSSDWVNPPDGLVWRAFVSAADTVSVEVANVSPATIDPPSQTVRVKVFPQ